MADNICHIIETATGARAADPDAARCACWDATE
jgi:hypothetical protein